MTRRFIIGIDKFDAAQNKEFGDFLHQYGGYWHWIENFWLLAVEGEEDIDTGKIRDKISALNKHARSIVLEVGEDVDWSGRGAKNASGKSQHDWLKKTWLGGEP